MDEALYNKEITCPVCSKKFSVTKVRAKSLKVSERETDFFVRYEGVNPMFYDAWVCENCGYSSLSDKFETITSRDAKFIQDNISSKWHKRSFSGERDVDEAIEAFKLALINLQARNAKSSEVAKVCLRIAWMFRLKKDSREIDFMNFALKGYSEAFERENFPIDKLDENTCMYIIGELSRRVGNLDESVKWFSKLISSPDARRNQNLMNMTRDQFQLVKDMQKDDSK